jgi:DNA-binding NarL/FixJ family response regulator
LPTAVAALRRMRAGEATMAAPIAAQALQVFHEPPVAAGKPSAPVDERALDWRSHAANPMRLSPGECLLVQALAQGARSAELASRMAISVEALGRRIGNVYRKLSWDVRSGSLSLLAA